VTGSLKWFVYTTDDGSDYALWGDESNIEAVMAGTQDYPDGGNITHGVPRNITPRFAVFESQGGRRKLKIPVLTTQVFNNLNGSYTINDPFSGGQMTFAYKRPEKIRMPKGADTGLNDGDAS